jgi:transglutaminase-like putative cysteine protease
MTLRLPPLSRDKSNTLLLLVTCMLVLAPHMLHLPGWVSLSCLTLLLWRGWITFKGHRMPPLWLLLPIAAAAMGGSYLTHKTFLGRDAGVTLLALLLTLKLLEMHAKRDLFMVVFVSFFLVLANFFYTQTIAMALLMGVTVLALLTTQLSFQYAARQPPLWQRLKFGALILALATPLTLVLFLLFPRVSGPLWNLPEDASRARTGLSDEMSPGNISQLASSDEVAFRVAFTDPPPSRTKLYWRGPVLGAFDGRTWRRMPHAAADPDSAARLISVRWRGTPIRHVVTLEANGHRSLFALDLAKAAPDIAGQGSGFSADLELLATRPLDQRLRYAVASDVDFELQAELPEADLAPWRALPPGFNPATRAYAAQLRLNHANDAQLINAALQNFRQAPFRYTLSPPLLGRDSIDEFLFTSRAGFCEHYAGAFVVLMRAAGMPARVVTGYQGGERNPVDGYLTVRQSDAHAWAEVWLAGKGWTRIDPTAAVAPERVEQNLSRAIPPRLLGGLLQLDLGRDSWLGSVRHNWDAVTNQWNQWVLNYSSEKQKDLLRGFGFEQPDWRTLVSLLFIAGSMAMALVAVPLLWRRKKTDPATALYLALCRDLARRGLPRAAHEGPHAYAARLATEHQKLPASNRIAIARFLARYEALQYALPGTRSRAEDIANLKILFTRCR